jgi:hypothetical protein
MQICVHISVTVLLETCFTQFNIYCTVTQVNAKTRLIVFVKCRYFYLLLMKNGILKKMA